MGLENYQKILTDDGIWANMQATAHFLIWTIFFQVLIGFSLAWLINKKFKGNDLWTTLIVLPMMLSYHVSGGGKAARSSAAMRLRVVNRFT